MGCMPPGENASHPLLRLPSAVCQVHPASLSLVTHTPSTLFSEATSTFTQVMVLAHLPDSGPSASAKVC